MHNVIIVVMIAACLAFQPHVVGKSNAYDFRREKMQHRRDIAFNNHQEKRLNLNKTLNIKMPPYIHIYNEEYKWPLIDITSSLNVHRHSSRENCVVARFDMKHL